MSKVKQVSVKHEYELYPLYQLVHGRHFGYKVSEIQAALYLLDANRSTFPKAKVAQKGLHVLELLAGSGEYSEAWKAVSNFNNGEWPLPDTYYSLEGVDPKNGRTDFYVGDLATVEVPTPHNFIFAPYFSVNSMLDMQHPKRLATRKNTVACLKNCASILSKSGGGHMYLHFAESAEDEPGEGDFEVFIPRTNGLRKLFGIKPTETAFLNYKHEEVRDYVNRVSSERLSKIKITASGKLVGEIKVKNPMTFRYWSMMELLDMLDEAGFDLNVLTLGHVHHREHDFLHVLPSQKTEHDEDDERGDPNIAIVYAPPAK